MVAELARRPQLEADLRLPQELLAEKLSLDVVNVATQQVVASRQLARNRSNEIFENLSADLFELRLGSSLGTFAIQADLRPALDLVVQLEPQIIEIAGKVLLEGEASSGKSLDDKEHPGLKNTAGHLGFLGHQHHVEFRNLRVKPLTAK